MDIDIDKILETFYMIEENCVYKLGIALEEMEIIERCYCNDNDCYECWKYALECKQQENNIKNKKKNGGI